MSKKSRKRNKKILAAIGIGLGAAALASKRKKELGDTETTSRMGSDFIKSKKPTIADVSNTAKKTTPKKETTVTTPTTIQDNKSTTPRNPKSIRVKTNTNKVYTDATGGESTAKVGNKKSTFVGKDGYARTGENATPMTTGRFGTLKAASEMSKGAEPPQLRKPEDSFLKKMLPKSNFKSGGRAGYKSGGSARGAGCAKRGVSKILLKGKR